MSRYNTTNVHSKNKLVDNGESRRLVSMCSIWELNKSCWYCSLCVPSNYANMWKDVCCRSSVYHAPCNRRLLPMVSLRYCL